MVQPSQNSENSQEFEPAEINDVLKGNIEVARGQIVRRKRERKPEFTDEENALILSWLELNTKICMGGVQVLPLLTIKKMLQKYSLKPLTISMMGNSTERWMMCSKELKT